MRAEAAGDLDQRRRLRCLISQQPLGVVLRGLRQLAERGRVPLLHRAQCFDDARVLVDELLEPIAEVQRSRRRIGRDLFLKPLNGVGT